MKKTGLVTCIPLLLSACASLHLAHPPADQKLSESREALGHVHARNWGLYLFNYIPLATGNPDAPDGKLPLFFTDRTRVEDAVDMVTRKGKDLGSGATLDLQTSTDSKWILPLVIIWVREVEASGNAVK